MSLTWSAYDIRQDNRIERRELVHDVLQKNEQKIKEKSRLKCFAHSNPFNRHA